MKARYHNVDIKRFINQDTITGSIANSQSLNQHCYNQGKPINFVDPFEICKEGGFKDLFKSVASFAFSMAFQKIYGESFQSYIDKTLNKIHNALDILGLFTDIADLANAVIYVMEGKKS